MLAVKRMLATARTLSTAGKPVTAGTEATTGMKATTGPPTQYGRHQKQGCLQKTLKQATAWREGQQQQKLCRGSYFFSYTVESSHHLMAAITPKEVPCQEEKSYLKCGGSPPPRGEYNIKNISEKSCK
jgi:hypothetical protein